MERFLVTGGLGCIGAWVAHELLTQGAEVVIGDVGGDRHRLAQLIPATSKLTEVSLDITDPQAVRDCFAAHRPTHVIHLAALQVPFCKADPILGARVNVVGTIALMEAMVAFLPDRTFVYASSVAAYGAPDDSDPHATRSSEPIGKPHTLYGVYKRANEDSAFVYFRDRGLSSIGLRPYVVYGVGRDQGVTSAPTAAMLAAVRGEEFHIPFGGRAVYHHARDAARAFIAAARSEPNGQYVVNLPGDDASMTDIVTAIRATDSDAAITFDDVQLPFPASVDTTDFDDVVGTLPRLGLAAGVAETMARFRVLEEARG